MNWIQCLTRAIAYIERNLTCDISIDKVAAEAYTSAAHFQLVFHVVMGMTVGEYIRNRRLSLAGQELLHPPHTIADVAARYRYETQASFSKAFTRFHGVPPSKAQKEQIKVFHPLTIHINIQGGFDMPQSFIDAFCLVDWNELQSETEGPLTSVEKYTRIVSWASQARSKNPGVFDALTEWILDDTNWSDESLAENEQILHGVLERFKAQNARLRAYLQELEPSGAVNAAVFAALDAFDQELAGMPHDEGLRETVAGMFANFSVMQDRIIRKAIAGSKTGPTGTDSVTRLGYINYLKDYDAQVQWTLFMPDMVKRQQQGFQVDSFTYKTLPAMRFIGREEEDPTDIAARKLVFETLDQMQAYASGFDEDVFLMHHYGLGVDVGPWHGFWGRFMQADTPVPEGFLSFDFVQRSDGKAGPPFCSQFAYAAFSGDPEALHKREGYDSDAMYDVTRNIILGQGVSIPYPHKYWTAEVFPDGFAAPGSAYLFGVEL